MISTSVTADENHHQNSSNQLSGEIKKLKMIIINGKKKKKFDDIVKTHRRGFLTPGKTSGCIQSKSWSGRSQTS